ncbi:MAG: bifunctional aspartate kinase/homoserine dehydrogenase I [Archangium sp.]|nr:bifunctional aspartate kinase/homoserine dehydrogenase I [Archangium sp.]MDP3574645.1 bifunctional aspartate kinase/homoserine dehydrogenase I [Archangium sp.]
MIGHKFGGSSVANAECISRVVDILLARSERQVVVISAMKGVTDALIELVKLAAARDGSWKDALLALELKHVDTARALLGAQVEPVLERLRAEFASLRDLLHAQSLIGAVSSDLMDLVSGLGEVWSSTLVDATLRARGANSRWLDAREVLVVEKSDLGAMVKWETSTQKLIAHLGEPGERTIVTGFVARTPDGRITTLGRNGSDYSGAIFAALFAAKELHIWSDVDGVLSADPRLVPEAVLIERLSYSEACELAYFGAKVIHPQTMAPAFERNIPIIARSTFNPNHTGTRISAERDLATPVKGVTTFTGLAILNIEGAGMIGVPGTAERAFQALKLAGVSVVMISQGSSEHSICCVIRETDGEAARKAVLEAFTRELQSKQLTDVTVTKGIAALAVVGDGMAGTPGVAARLFAALGRSGVNVRMIAQGASERNISVAIDAADARKALRAVHAGFYLSAQTISVGVIGPGNVGQAFLKMLHEAKERLLEVSNIDLRVRAVVGRKHMVLAEPTVSFENGKAKLETATDLDAFAAHVHADHLPHAVIVDCSPSDAVAEKYVGWLERGIHVITPNKNAGAGPLARYTAIKSKRAHFRYESTVGAGLPVINTLRDLIDTGDEVRSVEGIFSGTLAYLFNKFDGTVPFSALVRQAKELGYTEPDPRDDLSGLDVARKLTILARENGSKMELSEVALESLVPEALRAVSVADFMARLPELDAPMRAKFEAAKKEQRVLRYVAKLDAGGKASVGLVALPLDHSFAHIKLTDNVVQFTTKRYSENPLVVQGPGAGPEVTAAGVFADLLRVAAAIGAKL